MAPKVSTVRPRCTQMVRVRAAVSPSRAKAAIDWYRASFRRTVRQRRSSGPSRRVAAPTLVLWGA